MGLIRIGGACLNQTPLDWTGNLKNITDAINAAKAEDIKILCLPELCITGYGCEDMFLSEWLPNKAQVKLLEILPQTENITVAVGLPVRFNDQLYNTTCILKNTKIVGCYAKHHLANDGVHYEPRWFNSWPIGKVETLDIGDFNVPFGSITINYDGEEVGFEICEDAWRDDRPACHYSKNVKLILNPSASHFAFGKADYRKGIVVDSSLKFDCTYLYTNLLGNEAGRMIYDGDIMIAQNGEMIAENRRLSYRPFNILYADIDLQNPELSIHSNKDDWHGSIEEFGRTASLALFDYKRKSKSKGFVLSLSGGADSSSIATLVAESVRHGLNELGLEGLISRYQLELDLAELRQLKTYEQRRKIVGSILHTAYQGTENSSEATFESARRLANNLGAQFSDWKIDAQVEGYTENIERVLGRSLTWEKDDIALQNIQARARSPIIWMLANIKQSLLLTTSNRSEGDVGYATMDGDTSGSISPIAAVDKAFILKWLKYAEAELGYSGLNDVNNLRPTAELRPLDQEQTDEADLMPYDILVSIERHAIRDRQSPVLVFKMLSSKYDLPDNQLKQYVHKFFRLWCINQWKRERIAPSFHLDDFNVDPRTWCRFPILSSGFQEELEELKNL
ncbi:MAG: NAD(+) synthase [Bacteroidota bacterium]